MNIQQTVLFTLAINHSKKPAFMILSNKKTGKEHHLSTKKALRNYLRSTLFIKNNVLSIILYKLVDDKVIYFNDSNECITKYVNDEIDTTTNPFNNTNRKDTSSILNETCTEVSSWVSREDFNTNNQILDTDMSDINSKLGEISTMLSVLKNETLQLKREQTILKKQTELLDNKLDKISDSNCCTEMMDIKSEISNVKNEMNLFTKNLQNTMSTIQESVIKEDSVIHSAFSSDITTPKINLFQLLVKNNKKQKKKKKRI